MPPTKSHKIVHMGQSTTVAVEAKMRQDEMCGFFSSTKRKKGARKKDCFLKLKAIDRRKWWNKKM